MTSSSVIRSGTAAASGLVLGLLPASLTAQTMQPSFAVTGSIEAFTLDAPGTPTSGARMTVGNLSVVIPTNTMIVMPGKYASPNDLFPPNAQSGLALADAAPPKVAFEADIIGNITGGQYVAGVVRISQGALHAASGFVQDIDFATGLLHVGAAGLHDGARVLLNDPGGVYGHGNGDPARAALPQDDRFAADDENAAVHASTGFPVCVPRIDPAAASDPKCPSTNRPAGTGPAAYRFTCGTVPAFGDATIAVNPACDPQRPVPLRVGDYVTYSGILQPDPAGGFFVSAYGLDADLGIYTSPHVDPAYLLVEEAIEGTKGALFPGVTQEETTRIRVVGFTTDPSRNVEVTLLDEDRRSIAGVTAAFSVSGPVGLTPENGPPLGRVRFTWPSKDDARAVRRDVRLDIVGAASGATSSGLAAGTYGAPVSEFIYPEGSVFGAPGFPPPVPFENFCYLKNAGGAFDTVPGPLGPPAPFPNSGHVDSQQVGTGTARACDNR